MCLLPRSGIHVEEPSGSRSLNPQPSGLWEARRVQRLLAVMAVSAIPISSGFAASSSGAPGNTSSGMHGVHKGTPKGGIGAARAIETPGPGAPGITHRQPMIVPGKGNAKPTSTLRSFNGQGVNGPTVKAPGLGSQGDLSTRATGSLHGTAASAGIPGPGIHTLRRGMTNPLGAAPSIGSGVPRRPGELNGSDMGARGLTAAKIAPSPKANTGINGTGLGRRN
jgi:hypothetical protein